MTEEWRPVVGYEGLYEVSDQGRVRSLDRVVTHKNGRVRVHKSVLLKASPGVHGYPLVGIYRQCVVKMSKVHRLVMEAFVGPCPEGLQVLHADDIKTHNHLSNLRYGTSAENSLDAIRNGTHNYSRRTECKYGHEYTPENTRWAMNRYGRESRNCRACGREQQRRARRQAIPYIQLAQENP